MANVSFGSTSIENSIICPKIAENYILNSQKTIFAMKDLIGSLVETRESNEELIVSLMELSKSIDGNLRIGGISKIQDIKRGLVEKEKRAKENYNIQLSTLAQYSSKIKKCWGTLSAKDKKNAGEYINKFQQNKLFTKYKNCIEKVNETNQLYTNKYNHTYTYFQGKMTIQALGGEHSIINKNISKFKKDEYDACILLKDIEKSNKDLKLEKRIQDIQDFNPLSTLKDL